MIEIELIAGDGTDISPIYPVYTGRSIATITTDTYNYTMSVPSEHNFFNHGKNTYRCVIGIDNNYGNRYITLSHEPDNRINIADYFPNMRAGYIYRLSVTVDNSDNNVNASVTVWESSVREWRDSTTI
jgi:hypothetical protein